YVAADAHTALAYCWYVNSSNFRKNLTCNSTITFLSDYKNSLNNITLFVNDTVGNQNQTTIFFTSSTFQLYLNIQNSTFSNVPNATVSVAKMAGPPEGGGAPAAAETWNASTDANGNVTVDNLDATYQAPFTVRIKGYNGTDMENATYVGPILPPFPAQMLTQFMNATTIYVAPAANIRINAINITGEQDAPFRGMVFDNILKFPIEMFQDQNYALKTITVPLERNYSVVVFSMGQGGSPPKSITVLDVNLTQNLTVNGRFVFRYTFNMSTELFNLSGTLRNSTGGVFNYTNLVAEKGAGAANWTIKIVTYLSMAGMIPTDATMPTDMGNADYPYSANPGNGTFNMPVLGPNINYLITVFVNDSTNYYMGVQNISVTAAGPNATNITLYKLGGALDTTGSVVNTSRVTFNLIDGSTNQTAGQASIEAIVTYPINSSVNMTVNWMLNANNTGVFMLPLWNATPAGYTGVKLKIYSNRYSPRELTYPASLFATNRTINMMLKPFSMERPDGTMLDVQVYALVSNATCDVPNPNLALRSAGGCSLFNMSDDNFNPLKMLTAGKVSIRMVQANGVVIHYQNVDLLASGPPDAEYQDSAAESATSGTALQQIWKFGSMGPDIYQRALTGIPYSDSTYNDYGDFNMSLSYLYDNDWNVVWNATVNTTEQIPSDFADFSGATYVNLINKSSPMQCSKTNASATCYVDKTNNMFWMWIPHFSGNAPAPNGSSDLTAPTRTLAVTTSSVIIGSSTTISCESSDASGVASTAINVRKPGGTYVNTTCGTSFTDTADMGTYTITYSATDNMNNTGSTTLTFTASASGGSTGGGGGVPVAKTIYAIDVINPGTASNIDINQADIVFKQISVEVNSKVTNVDVTVSKLSDKPSSVTQDVSGNVYQYLEITHNLAEGVVKSAKIKFTVSKSWLVSNGLDSGTVSLNRYVNGNWEKLTTTKLSESDDTIEFEAISTGFSVFAVTASKLTAPTQPTEPTGAVCGNNVKESGEDCDGTDLAGKTCVALGYDSGTLACSNCKFDSTNCKTKEVVTPTTKPKTDYTILGILALAFIALLGIIYYHKGKSKRGLF
ncbi:MAG: PGF-pre-PGF domain-containing protein, partial [Candidatus Aenigmatarchaeota archaeon]